MAKLIQPWQDNPSKPENFYEDSAMYEEYNQSQEEALNDDVVSDDVIDLITEESIEEHVIDIITEEPVEELIVSDPYSDILKDIE